MVDWSLGPGVDGQPNYTWPKTVDPRKRDSFTIDQDIVVYRRNQQVFKGVYWGPMLNLPLLDQGRLESYLSSLRVRVVTREIK